MKPTHYKSGAVREERGDSLCLVVDDGQLGGETNEVQGVLQVLLLSLLEELPELGSPESVLGLAEHQLLHQALQIPRWLPSSTLLRLGVTA